MSETDTVDTRSAKPIRRAILAILWVQIGIGAFLAGSDVMSGLDGVMRPSSAPSFDQPVRPGDQTRRFEPANAPDLTTDPSRRTPFPGGDNVPSRLAFEAANGTAFVKGQITPGDAVRFDEWLATVNVDRVRLMSPGGSVQDALHIGRTIRRNALETVMLAGDFCYSACPYVLAGGTSRQIDDEASVGVHQHYFDENTVLPAFIAVENIQRGQAEVVAYLTEMGIDLRVTEHALSTPPDEIYVLVPEELVEYGFTTAEEA